ncbi:replication initiator [Pseudonocardia kujensis]|uniref:replication initiator n=1 Tax=Pseudonocardia kujensis TaxID=1128675 RepID=UPI0035561C56
MALRRALAARLGVSGRRFARLARLSYAKVAEYQRRGLVHFHAAIRLDGPDGPDGPADPPPAGLDGERLRDAIQEATTATALDVERPDGTTLRLRWGAQLDLREITPTAHEAVTDDDGEITDTRLAGYIAKYATKGTGKTDDHPDRPIRSLAHLERMALATHHRRLIETAWHLGHAVRGAQPAQMGAHARLPRHFLTKSRAYSTTFRTIRGKRRAWRLAEQLDQLGHPADEPSRRQRLAPRRHRPPHRSRPRTRPFARRTHPGRTQDQEDTVSRRKSTIIDSARLTYTVEEVAVLLSISRGIADRRVREGGHPCPARRAALADLPPPLPRLARRAGRLMAGVRKTPAASWRAYWRRAASSSPTRSAGHRAGRTTPTASFGRSTTARTMMPRGARDAFLMPFPPGERRRPWSRTPFRSPDQGLRQVGDTGIEPVTSSV